MTDLRKTFATEIAEKWGPALTQAFVEGDISSFRDLFASDKPVWVVLQNSQGEEAEFTIADTEISSTPGPEEGEDTTTTGSGSGAFNPEIFTMTWDEFKEASCKDLAAQNYAKTEAQCLGVLGNRMILEVGRFNKDGFVYMESYSLLTVDRNGKVEAVETFSDPQVLGNIVTSVSEKAAAAASLTTAEAATTTPATSQD